MCTGYARPGWGDIYKIPDLGWNGEDIADGMGLRRPHMVGVCEDRVGYKRSMSGDGIARK